MTDVELLNSVSIFSQLSPDSIRELLSLMIKRSYHKHETIFIENDFGDSLFIITRGNVKITRFSETGREVIFTILSEGDYFGEISLLDDEGRLANSIALGDVEVLMIKRHDFLLFLEKYPQIVFSLLSEMACRNRQHYQQIESLTLGDAQYRIGLTLFHLAEQLGTIKNGVVTIRNIPFNYDIANMVGTCKETVSRIFTLFNQKGMIERDGRNLSILDYKQFKRLFN